ncbi:MAG TPA: dihydrofolate reductase family protein [Gaiellaceae bacterium]|nr:dihydrofolate reductase family protein [Gaiellaceae bacterium]
MKDAEAQPATAGVARRLHHRTGRRVWRWWEALPDDDEADEYLVATLRRAATHVMGRNTYEAMAAHWPNSSAPVAQVMNDIPKVVFSKTLQSADWPETRIAGGDTTEEIARLKSEPGGDIVAHGGVRFAQSLIRLDVVDEYRLYVYPIAVGSGSSLFAAVEGLRPLRLVSSTAFPSGVVELVYVRTA